MSWQDVAYAAVPQDSYTTAAGAYQDPTEAAKGIKWHGVHDKSSFKPRTARTQYQNEYQRFGKFMIRH